MSKLIFRYTLGLTAGVAMALGLAGSLPAQEQKNSDEQTQKQQDNKQQNDKSASQSNSQEKQRTDQQQIQRQREQQEQQRREQERQRNEGRSSQDSDRSSRDNAWPQPNGRDYGSDSLRYDGENNSDRNKQGGLGVNLVSDDRDGVIVSRVHPGSPAQEMGIRERDRITQVNGREVRSVQQFIARIRNMQPGEKIELDIRRAAGDERTVRGELESRQQALADRGGRGERARENQRDSQFTQRDRSNQQAGYNETRDSWTDTQGRSAQFSSNRLDQIERQVDRLSREIDQLRASLQGMRRQSGDGNSSQWSGERTASYDEEQRSTTSRSTSRDRDWDDDDAGTYRQADRRNQRSDRFDDGPGGEIGEDRLRVNSDNIDRD